MIVLIVLKYSMIQRNAKTKKTKSSNLPKHGNRAGFNNSKMKRGQKYDPEVVKEAKHQIKGNKTQTSKTKGKLFQKCKGLLKLRN